MSLELATLEDFTRTEQGLEIAAADLGLLQSTYTALTLVSRKVESRASNTFKCIISQLMKEAERLAKNVSEELGKPVLSRGEINLIFLCPFHLEMFIYCPLVSLVQWWDYTRGGLISHSFTHTSFSVSSLSLHAFFAVLFFSSPFSKDLFFLCIRVFVCMYVCV